jgi:hypothetical protein
VAIASRTPRYPSLARVEGIRTFRDAMSAEPTIFPPGRGVDEDDVDQVPQTPQGALQPELHAGRLVVLPVAELPDRGEDPGVRGPVLPGAYESLARDLGRVAGAFLGVHEVDVVH